MSMVAAFLHAFVPLFVAMDVVGLVPLYLGMVERLTVDERRRMLRSSLVVAAATSISFALLGKAVFLFVGITVADFKIAGGLILVGLAARDLLAADPRAVVPDADLGVVPLGVPLIVGPAVITTTIVLVDTYGTLVTVLALVVNLAVCGVVLARAAAVERVLGRVGARAMSKIVSLLLAAIGVQFVRQGLALQP